MRAGLVKSLERDKRCGSARLLESLSSRPSDDDERCVSVGRPTHHAARAGLQKLKRLEQDFGGIDPARHPKMLVVCEDTNVSPLVAQFLVDEARRRRVDGGFGQEAPNSARRDQCRCASACLTWTGMSSRG